MSYQQHQSEAKRTVETVGCAVVTLSDTRTLETDASGSLIAKLLTGQNHTIAQRDLIRDDPTQLQTLLDGLLVNPSVQAILTTGGTGIARRDNTIGVVERMLTTPIPGFGELFRSISYTQIGSGAMLSRAVAGIVNTSDDRRVLIFCMPGSAHAVELAMTKLILPELKHLVWELQR
ncbi:MAG: MogA/MoaB family molybdenum cofactor biosynthesis protein [Tepidisphaeraceae bacterium]